MKRHCCTWTIEVLHLRCRKTRGTGCVATWTWLVLHVAFRHPASTWCVWYGRCKCPAELLKQQLYIANLFAEMILLASSSLLFGVFLYFWGILISWKQHPLFSICQTVRYSRFKKHVYTERCSHYSYSLFGSWAGCLIEFHRYYYFHCSEQYWRCCAIQCLGMIHDVTRNQLCCIAHKTKIILWTCPREYYWNRGFGQNHPHTRRGAIQSSFCLRSPCWSTGAPQNADPNRSEPRPNPKLEWW